MLPMAKGFKHQAFIFLGVVLLLINQSEQLQSSQTRILLRLQLLLNYPDVLSSWNSSVDFCNAEPTSQVTVVCYEESITQLHITGNKGTLSLPRSFSMDSFVTTLVKLPDLRVLTLVSLGLWGRCLTLILGENMFSGQLPDWLGSFPVLTVLSLRNNSFNGSLPSSFSMLENLRVLALSHNHFQGELPDLSGLTNLQELDLEDNAFGPRFPQLGNKLVLLVLGKNMFRSGFPPELTKISSYNLPLLAESAGKVGHRTSALTKDSSNSSRFVMTSFMILNLYDIGLTLIDPSYQAKPRRIYFSAMKGLVPLLLM
ncbi:hypothetical protein F3Y22_tig00016115pilonHSYRG00012 [Hibiscus syriacus]|uniref:Leucine-rich repeat-containing N-terminal plant-type domain-containing protein n=1 Tax=Hibiscus syriacus TaxID=106335 RepID=A0A6A3BZU6_HIBSY|nr:hypothetical protein F3Y22_tig00016115pilonHSYRG00012 [Hibiscus syriacus]